MSSTPIRIIIFIIVFALVVVLPWWISILILLALTIYFPLYLEVLFFGFLFDTLYSVHFNFPYTGLSLTAVFLLITIFFKTQIRINRSKIND